MREKERWDGTDARKGYGASRTKKIETKNSKAKNISAADFLLRSSLIFTHSR